MLRIRSAEPGDEEAIWTVLEPVIRGGETYALPREMSRRDAIAYWFASSHQVFVAESEGQVVGTYFLRPNQGGGGSHVSNCGYVTAPEASGKGVATAMCSHSLDHAAKRGFRAMQFNFVVSINDRAVRLWQRFNFDIVGRLPGAFLHPVHGYVDVYVMHRNL
jgi:GNAT superfamily N-acetyltransferase